LRRFCLSAQIRREAALMAQHPENDVIDTWNEAAYDWSGWKWSAAMSCRATLPDSHD
jgi:hypothetical protein